MMIWFAWILVFILAVTLVFGGGFALWILAEVLSKLFNIIGFTFSIFSSFVRLKWVSCIKTLNAYFYDLALSKDQHSNVVLRDFFNKIMLKRHAILFGDPDHTLSYYFAVNKLLNDSDLLNCGLSKFGLFWAKFLNLFERSKGGHLHTALFSQMLKEDLVLKNHGFITNPDFEKWKLSIIEKFENSL